MEFGWRETDLPGFRFHPTEEELLEFFLKGAVQGNKLVDTVIAFLDIYEHDPSELPGLSRVSGKEWYFFVRRERSIANGGKPRRTTRRGFWKATGSDRSVHSVADPGRLIGLKKTLVFYEGRAPRGNKTDWIMNEFRLPDGVDSSQLPKANVVLCKIYRKAKSMSEAEKRVASATASMVPQEEAEESAREAVVEAEVSSSRSGVKFQGDLGMLQVPPRLDFDWAADLNLLRTPWLDHVSPCYANIFNF